jgi:hypothetical protein
MPTLQPITHRGRLAAIVVADQAILDGSVSPEDERHVKAMCLYAMEIAAGDRRGPYTDPAADAYAKDALGRA